MKIQPLYANPDINFKNNERKYSMKKRLTVLGGGMTLGTAAGLLYFSKAHNYKGKKLWLNSMELGAGLTFAIDMLHLLDDSIDGVKKENQ